MDVTDNCTIVSVSIYVHIPHPGSGQLLVHYSRSLAALFSEAAEAIRNLAKSEAPGLPTTMERTRCGVCGRLLPERDGLCPFCVRKWDTIKRIARFLARRGEIPSPGSPSASPTAVPSSTPRNRSLSCSSPSNALTP